MKLICFAHAGGFASYYSFLRAEAFSGVDEVICYEYPGRGTRSGERPFESMQEAISCIANEMKELAVSEKLIFLGYSMGAYIAYEVALHMKKKFRCEPQLVCIVSQVPPEEYQEITEDYSNDEKLTDYLVSMGGIEEKLKNNKEVLSYFLQVVRTDFKLLQGYSPSKKQEVKIKKMAVLYGKQDQIIQEKTIENWKNYADLFLGKKKFHGGHFFVMQYKHSFLEWINYYIEQATDVTEERG